MAPHLKCLNEAFLMRGRSIFSNGEQRETVSEYRQNKCLFGAPIIMMELFNIHSVILRVKRSLSKSKIWHNFTVIYCRRMSKQGCHKEPKLIVKTIKFWNLVIWYNNFFLGFLMSGNRSILCCYIILLISQNKLYWTAASQDAYRSTFEIVWSLNVSGQIFVIRGKTPNFTYAFLLLRGQLLKERLCS